MRQRISRDSRLAPEEFSKGVAYLSDQAHSSNEKGLRIIGFRQDQIVKIPTDGDFKMRVDLLDAAIDRDLHSGRKPFAVIGSLGTTNTGSIDPLEAVGHVARKYGLWFHIDGAFGASILISPIYRNLAKGIELSDSFSWDTHKWLMQIYSCSTLIVKDKKHLLYSFTEHPEYLADVSSSEHNDAWDLGPEMSRPARAIKLWYTLQATGTDLLAELIEYSFYKEKSHKLLHLRMVKVICISSLRSFSFCHCFRLLMLSGRVRLHSSILRCRTCPGCIPYLYAFAWLMILSQSSFALAMA